MDEKMRLRRSKPLTRHAEEPSKNGRQDAQAQIDAVSAPVTQNDDIRECGNNAEAALTALLRDEAFLEKYVYADPAINEVIIRRYLLRLSGNKGVPTLGGKVGACALPALPKPKTLDEAKKMAELFLRR